MIRMAQIKDLDDIMEVYAYARKFMAESGNPTQWGSTYPDRLLIKEDIKNKRMYVIDEADKVHAVFMFAIGEDETYKIIKNGQWMSDKEYGVIHRVASDGQIKGVLNSVVGFCMKRIKHLRIDTHKDNKIMQHQILKNGFKECGIINLENGDERIAYEKI